MTRIQPARWQDVASVIVALGLTTGAVATTHTVLFVDDDAGDVGDGSDWSLAYPDLQQALTVAQSLVRAALLAMALTCERFSLT